MQELILSEDNPIIMRDTSLRLLYDRPFRLQGGSVIFCTAGRARVFLNTDEHEIQADMQMIVFPDSTVMVRDADEDFQVVFLYFTQRMFEEAHRQFDPSFFRYIRARPVYRHSGVTAAAARQLFSVIKTVYADVENHYRLVMLSNHLRNIFLDMYDKIRRNIVHDAPVTYRRKAELFHKFIELIIANCIEHREVEFYADKLCISKRYLAAVTREIADRTPKTMIDKHVIQEIELMLAFSDMPLQQIADYMNFPDQSYLGRYFKRYTGKSLMGYRSGIASM